MSVAVDLAALALDDFAPHVGSRFRIAEPALELALEAADARAGGGEHGRAFALTFHGPAAPRLGQGIQPLEHPALGRLEIFLVPIAGDAESTRYEAIFA